MTWNEDDSHHLTRDGRAMKEALIREAEELEAFRMMTSRWYRNRRRAHDLIREIRYRIAGL